ncbi:putative methyltransferase tdiE [Colletotrichum orbiculare MAFF 240422]|uniref:Methyltransferase tdiE n=1 Tax=Colletotrichum orbiculare (strain 104-T / ATCC 96160 / CBS 514.97 / LARS 414 / MAFF 240422) TaxID=1213857 RepID=A0A484FD50_COLOR|nr:putative methyltransferase tdiE [Colletotrichum orbiculare MAFF 240422]
MPNPSEEESVPVPNTGPEVSPAPQPGSSIEPVSDLPATTSGAAPIVSYEPGHGSGNIPLEADEGEVTDDASSLDERLSSYTASLTSSVVDYPEEYGRRYHAFRSGSYQASPHPRYRNRNRHLGNRGWRFVPQCRSGWERLERLPANLGSSKSSIGDWPKLVKNVYDHLNPGGWAEFQDMSVEYYSDDDSYKPEHATWDWNMTFVKTLKSIGRDPCPGPQLEGWVRGNGGFERITHRKFKVPIGPWPKHQPYKDLGLLNLAQILEGLEGFTLKLFCGILGKSKEEVQVQLARVRNELKGNAFHSLFDIHVVYGQKPL